MDFKLLAIENHHLSNAIERSDFHSLLRDFQLSVEVNCAFAEVKSVGKIFAPLSPDPRTKTNRDLLARVFPRLLPATLDLLRVLIGPFRCLPLF